MPSSLDKYGTDAFDAAVIRRSLSLSDDGALVVSGWDVPERYRERAAQLFAESAAAWRSSARAGDRLGQRDLGVLAALVSMVIDRDLEPIPAVESPPSEARRVQDVFRDLSYAPYLPPAAAMAAATLAPVRGDMTADSKPSRFSMIAEELAYDPKPRATDVRPGDAPTMRAGAGGPECPRCGCGAFEPVAGGYALCLGCPPPAPSYPVPYGVKLDTARYRCSRCGKQRQVTCALSDVNLHCDGCGGRLALHARQDPPKASVSGRAATWDDPETATAWAFTALLGPKKDPIAELAAAFSAELTGAPAPRDSVTPLPSTRSSAGIAISDVIVDIQRTTSSSNNYSMVNFDYDKAERAALAAIERKLMDPVSELSLEVTKKRVSDMMRLAGLGLEVPTTSGPTWEDRGAPSLDELSAAARGKPMNIVVGKPRRPPSDEVGQLARDLAAELGLIDFEEYALRQAEENRRRGVKDTARRTGRTWCGLLHAIARCRLGRAEVLSVHGGPRANTAYIKETALRWLSVLERGRPSEHPSLVTTLRRPDLAERGGADERGRRVVVYRDHNMPGGVK